MLYCFSTLTYRLLALAPSAFLIWESRLTSLSAYIYDRLQLSIKGLLNLQKLAPFPVIFFFSTFVAFWQRRASEVTPFYCDAQYSVQVSLAGVHPNPPEIMYMNMEWLLQLPPLAWPSRIEKEFLRSLDRAFASGDVLLQSYSFDALCALSLVWSATRIPPVVSGPDNASINRSDWVRDQYCWLAASQHVLVLHNVNNELSSQIRQNSF